MRCAASRLKSELHRANGVRQFELLDCVWVTDSNQLGSLTGGAPLGYTAFRGTPFQYYVVWYSPLLRCEVLHPTRQHLTGPRLMVTAVQTQGKQSGNNLVAQLARPVVQRQRRRRSTAGRGG